MQTTNKKRPGKKEPTVDELLAAIAKATLHIDTLETRKSDSLDFHDVAVWSVKAALEAGLLVFVAIDVLVAIGAEHLLARRHARQGALERPVLLHHHEDLGVRVLLL